MRIRELLEAQDDLAKFFQKQQAQDLKKKKIAAQKNVSYYVKIYPYPGLSNTVGVYWVTPDQLHFTYSDAQSISQTKKLSADNAIRDFSNVVFGLGEYDSGDPLSRKRIEVQIPSNLQKISPLFYKGVMEWQSRVSMGTLGKLISFKTVDPVVAEPAVKPSASSVSAPSAPTIIKPTRDQIEHMFKRVFTSDPSLSQLLRANRTASVEKDIYDIIIDNWGEEFNIISDEIRDYLSSI